MTLELGRVTRGPHLSTLVASSIVREIAEGRLQPGDQLPTEQSLAETFGVSRNVVREAIARLRSEGRVWSRQGRGAFVSDTASAAALTIDHEGLRSANAFRGLFELRGMLEVEAAALAALRRGEADLAALSARLAEMIAAPYGGVAWLGADLDFHRAITMATGNIYITQVLGFVSEQVRASILASGHSQGSVAMAENTIGEHRAILDAIAAGDETGAREAMRRHLGNAAERVGLHARDPAQAGSAAPDEAAAVSPRADDPPPASRS